MEPEVVRMYSSSPPPLEDGAEEEDEDEFGDFGGFSGVSASVSFTEFDTPAGTAQSQCAADTSPPTLCTNGHKTVTEQAQTKTLNSHDTEMENGRTSVKSVNCNGGGTVSELLTNGFGAFESQDSTFADFSAFPDTGTYGDVTGDDRTVENSRVLGTSDTLSNGDCIRESVQTPEESTDGTDGEDMRLPTQSTDTSEGQVAIDHLIVSEDSLSGDYACPEETTDAAHSELSPQKLEDEDFGDFGDANSCGCQGFADFDQNIPSPSRTDDVDDDGVSDAKDQGTLKEKAECGDFPSSDSFADFSSAPTDDGTDFDSGWNAFSEQDRGTEDSWAAFGEESSVQESVSTTPKPSSGESQTCRQDNSVLLSSRLERLFQTTFPEVLLPEAGNDVLPLKVLLQPLEPPPEPSEDAGEETQGRPRDVWQQLQDVHNAFGLRHQWGGSHCNKMLLCSLGIDTRNILFTGQKKQPVIVPMYAASLGMLEPTKEPVKPISAAEKIASIAQVPPVPPESSTCSSDPAQQEALPPIQFDWSSSGLTNPLDASGGSSLLNLDFFGPVEDSSSSATTSIPGVDPELYELTTAKLETSNSSSRVADAFARLMSTVEKTSTSTRKPRKEENLSEEAAKVIAGLPDLSFMQAKVLMFPTTLTPLDSSTGAASASD